MCLRRLGKDEITDVQDDFTVLVRRGATSRGNRVVERGGGSSRSVASRIHNRQGRIALSLNVNISDVLLAVRRSKRINAGALVDRAGGRRSLPNGAV